MTTKNAVCIHAYMLIACDVNIQICFQVIVKTELLSSYFVPNCHPCVSEHSIHYYCQLVVGVNSKHHITGGKN